MYLQPVSLFFYVLQNVSISKQASGGGGYWYCEKNYYKQYQQKKPKPGQKGHAI
jgi:hypothetical protein